MILINIKEVSILITVIIRPVKEGNQASKSLVSGIWHLSSEGEFLFGSCAWLWKSRGRGRTSRRQASGSVEILWKVMAAGCGVQNTEFGAFGAPVSGKRPGNTIPRFFPGFPQAGRRPVEKWMEGDIALNWHVLHAGFLSFWSGEKKVFHRPVNCCGKQGPTMGRVAGEIIRFRGLPCGDLHGQGPSFPLRRSDASHELLAARLVGPVGS